MESLWSDQAAAQCNDELDLRVYSSRLLGRNKELVLHGGGNTSVKIREQNLLGDEQDILYVKGSGSDLVDISRAGFAPVQLDHLIKLANLPRLSDPLMVNELKTHVTISNAPTPSVEAILHAILPYKYVDHTHANAVITVTNTPDGLQRVQEIYGGDVVVIPYVMPGFDLARLCAELFFAEQTNGTLGMVLMNHGIFSFGQTARESYERMIALVSRAEQHIKDRKAWQINLPAKTASPVNLRQTLAQLRNTLSHATGTPMIVRQKHDAAIAAFLSHPDLGTISQQGPATPDHVIRTKRFPMLGRDVDAYARAYRHYFDDCAKSAREPKTMLDTAPRVILDNELGLCTVGKTAQDAFVVQEIYEHTMGIIQRATQLQKFVALPAKDIFDVEYWDLEQAKLRNAGKPKLFAGEVALVTGAASGIGKACVDSLLARGACVIGMDLNVSIETMYTRLDYLGVRGDVTSLAAIQTALETGARRFGGLDMLILNAGIFPAAKNIAAMDIALWQQTLDINLTANLLLLREAHPLLKLAPNKGRVVIIGSKNVPAPGPGASAYSASKAALNQLMRVCALEWGQDQIRINTVHPNAVFDTGLWTEEVLQSRATSYGLTVAQYKKRNVLGVEVTRQDVAELAAELCGPLFAKTTAAQIPVDGGDQRVI
jgi:rhamnose utilization protein RhaD (predicted bifunctional aldolase and dehydrogenase)/NAD(P)-dependent dehydrogenase (short-subunit alcohol dehydrogenase family)